jgi:L-lactate utilization protein LutC
VPPADGSLDNLLTQRFPQARVICSATREVLGNRDIETVSDARDLHDVDVGVVRAVFAVAETGSVALSEREFGINALGFLSQHLVVLLDRRYSNAPWVTASASVAVDQLIRARADQVLYRPAPARVVARGRS